jgi:hypothetical protein
MSPELCAAIEAATDLAWRPTCNLAVKASYRARHESHERLVSAIGSVRHAVNGPPALAYLWLAILRVARCSFANRMGAAYYERKEAVRQLRGCLDVWRKGMLEAMG